ncbi:MAG TPA: hypothetical protein VIS72_11370 [Anaerolineales bacterium]
MTKTRFISTVSLLLLLLASCAPAAVTQAPIIDQPSVQEPAPPVAAEPSATPFAPADQSTEDIPTPTEAVVSDPLPVATSRGPDLHATDPNTVSLASGQLQFVEFFRFT